MTQAASQAGTAPETVSYTLHEPAILLHIILYIESRGGLVVSTQVRQSEGSSRSGQIAYFHGVKIRLAILGTGDVPRGSDST